MRGQQQGLVFANFAMDSLGVDPPPGFHWRKQRFRLGFPTKTVIILVVTVIGWVGRSNRYCKHSILSGSIWRVQKLPACIFVHASWAKKNRPSISEVATVATILGDATTTTGYCCEATNSTQVERRYARSQLGHVGIGGMWKLQSLYFPQLKNQPHVTFYLPWGFFPYTICGLSKGHTCVMNMIYWIILFFSIASDFGMSQLRHLNHLNLPGRPQATKAKKKCKQKLGDTIKPLATVDGMKPCK